MVSHSLVADRQRIFWNYFGSQDDVSILQIYPRRWGPLQASGGYHVTSHNMFSYLYTDDARRRLKEYEPDLVYIQEEVYSLVTKQIIRWMKSLNHQPKIGVFVWENLRKDEVYRNMPEGVDFIVAGSPEAAEIHKTGTVLPQVGIDFDCFRPMEIPRDYDLVFASRKVKSKGYDIVQKLPYKIRMTQGEDYVALPQVYNSAKIHIVLSQDELYWKEQFLPYTNVEALACGLTCIVGDVEATRFWGNGCPGLTLVWPNDIRQVDYEIRSQLSGWTQNDDGRRWAEERFSLKAVTGDLMPVFQSQLARR